MKLLHQRVISSSVHTVRKHTPLHAKGSTQRQLHTVLRRSELWRSTLRRQTIQHGRYEILSRSWQAPRYAGQAPHMLSDANRNAVTMGPYYDGVGDRKGML